MATELQVEFFAHAHKATSLLRRSISVLKNVEAGVIPTEKAIELIGKMVAEAGAETDAAMKACKKMPRS